MNEALIQELLGPVQAKMVTQFLKGEANDFRDQWSQDVVVEALLERIRQLTAYQKSAKFMLEGFPHYLASIQRHADGLEYGMQPLSAGALLTEGWYVCGHPAWPAPLEAGASAAEAVKTLRYCRSGGVQEGWLLRTVTGGRIEFQGDALNALIRKHLPKREA